MTDTQRYFAIGIPAALFLLNFLGVLAGFFWQAKRFDDMGKRLDDIKEIFRADLARVEGVLSARLDTLDAKISMLDSRVKVLEDAARSTLVR